MRTARAVCVLTLVLASSRARAFCGFYVAKADAELFNHASQVVLARDGDHTVVTMANDFKGDLTEFAVVVPVPTVLEKDQIHIGESRLIQRIDGWSGPRLVEYFDPDPCRPPMMYNALGLRGMGAGLGGLGMGALKRSPPPGVKIEAEYTVGEYDIAILSAEESTGLETYLTQEGYRLPPKAADALAPYIKQDMKFFVAKVNLKEQARIGFQTLRPIQIAYTSKKFMVPIRLGMANSEGSQDLVLYAITRNGRVESTNYRTVKMPSEEKVPLFVKDDFKHVYKAIFERSYRQESRRGVFTEYAWNAASCDPCAEQPLSGAELRGLGAYWATGSGPAQTFITRLHVRYDRDHFPEDLVFQETGDQQSFQARYVLTHPFKGNLSCSAGVDYARALEARRTQELTTLASLTGWSRERIADRMGDDAPQPAATGDAAPWYRALWK